MTTDSGIGVNNGDCTGRIERTDDGRSTSRLLVTTDISIVPYGSLPRETYKAALVDYSDSMVV
jgi:hypothetical protein